MTFLFDAFRKAGVNDAIDKKIKADGGFMAGRSDVAPFSTEDLATGVQALRERGIHLSKGDVHILNEVLNSSAYTPHFAKCIETMGMDTFQQGLVEGAHPAAERRIALAKAAYFQSHQPPSTGGPRYLVTPEIEMEGFMQWEMPGEPGSCQWPFCDPYWSPIYNPGPPPGYGTRYRVPDPQTPEEFCYVDCDPRVFEGKIAAFANGHPATKPYRFCSVYVALAGLGVKELVAWFKDPKNELIVAEILFWLDVAPEVIPLLGVLLLVDLIILSGYC